MERFDAHVNKITEINLIVLPLCKNLIVNISNILTEYLHVHKLIIRICKMYLFINAYEFRDI